MVFSSTVFLMMFLPAVWLIHAAIPKKFLGARNFFLSVASLLFYAYGEPVYIILMLASVLFNYVFAIAIDRFRGKFNTFLCGIAIAINLGMLGVFKYSPWLVSMLNSATGAELPVPDLVIPVGISFYTFQILSYVIDVKRRTTPVQKNFFDLLLYVSFFPQLIAGPIVKYNDIDEQIRSRTITSDGCALGIRRFIYGLSKKVLVSNTAAIIADAAFGTSDAGSASAWAGAICYCIQLYFDFSGYSDMAIGLASMFGFRLNENFNYPYSAVSIRDFWKRWHISLTSWFREYVYFPLGGNRCGKARTIFNRIFVFFLTGLWHGANFTFVIWGMWHGLLMMFEQLVGFDRIASKKYLQPFTRLYTLLAVCLGFVVFRASDISSAFAYIGNMFSFGGGLTDILHLLSPYTCFMIIFGLVFSMPILPELGEFGKKHPKLGTAGNIAGFIICIPLLVLCIMSLASSSFNPFIYYHF